MQLNKSKLQPSRIHFKQIYLYIKKHLVTCISIRFIISTTFFKSVIFVRHSCKKRRMEYLNGFYFEDKLLIFFNQK